MTYFEVLKYHNPGFQQGRFCGRMKTGLRLKIMFFGVICSCIRVKDADFAGHLRSRLDTTQQPIYFWKKTPTHLN